MSQRSSYPSDAAGMAITAVLVLVLLISSTSAQFQLPRRYLPVGTSQHRELSTALVIGKGFNPQFLGVQVGLPAIGRVALQFGSPAIIPGTGSEIELKYTYFSIIMNQQRRLAFVSAANIDGATKLDVPRTATFTFDPRLPREWQCGNELYRDNYLDRGHLTRSEDTNWGTAETAELADRESFYYTNISPQHTSFNTGKGMWQGLENYYLGIAVAEKAKISVFTGPIFSNSDTLYRGVRIPQAFFKLVVRRMVDGSLATSAYIGNHTELIQGLREEDDGGVAENDPKSPPQSGPDPYLSYLVPVTKVEALTGLMWDDVVRATDVTLQMTAATKGSSP